MTSTSVRVVPTHRTLIAITCLPLIVLYQPRVSADRTILNTMSSLSGMFQSQNGGHASRKSYTSARRSLLSARVIHFFPIFPLDYHDGGLLKPGVTRLVCNYRVA